MKQKHTRVLGIAIVVGLFAIAGSVSAYKESIVIGPSSNTTFDDTGETPAGASLSGTLSNTVFWASLSTTRSVGSGSHHAVMMWYCNNGFGDGAEGTFSTSGTKFSRFCASGIASSVAAIDDL